MSRTVDVGLVKRALRLRKQGETQQKIADKLGMSLRTVQNYLNSKWLQERGLSAVEDHPIHCSDVPLVNIHVAAEAFLSDSVVDRSKSDAMNLQFMKSIGPPAPGVFNFYAHESRLKILTDADALNLHVHWPTINAAYHDWCSAHDNLYGSALDPLLCDASAFRYKKARLALLELLDRYLRMERPERLCPRC
jgi:hypothetical protein